MVKCLFCGERNVDSYKICQVLYFHPRTYERMKRLQICVTCWNKHIFGKVSSVELKNWCLDRIATMEDDGTIADYHNTGDDGELTNQ